MSAYFLSITDIKVVDFSWTISGSKLYQTVASHVSVSFTVHNKAGSANVPPGSPTGERMCSHASLYIY